MSSLLFHMGGFTLYSFSSVNFQVSRSSSGAGHHWFGLLCKSILGWRVTKSLLKLFHPFFLFLCMFISLLLKVITLFFFALENLYFVI